MLDKDLPYKESEPFEQGKCAHCQKELSPHEALCLDCERMMLSYTHEDCDCMSCLPWVF